MELQKVLEVSTTVGQVHDPCCEPLKSLAASRSQQVGKLEFWGIPGACRPRDLSQGDLGSTANMCETKH